MQSVDCSTNTLQMDFNIFVMFRAVLYVKVNVVEKLI